MKKRVITVAGVLVLMIILVFSKQIGRLVGRASMSNFESGKNETKIIQALVKTANTLNKQLPQRIDKVTELRNVMALKKTLIYFYVVDIKHADIGKNFIPLIRKSVIRGTCSTPEMVKSLKLGITFSYSYRSIDNVNLGKTEIVENDCK